jgi:hypothetical protein
MSKNTILYKRYKETETMAFNLVFGHSEWRNWTFRELMRLTEKEIPSLGPSRKVFLSLLKSATACRLKVFANFVNAPEIRKAQHSYVVLCYQRIINLISSADVACPDEVHGHEEDHTGFASGAEDSMEQEPTEQTIHRLQGYDLFDILGRYIDAILNLWQQAREEAVSILTATTGTLLVFGVRSPLTLM